MITLNGGAGSKGRMASSCTYCLLKQGCVPCFDFTTDTEGANLHTRSDRNPFVLATLKAKTKVRPFILRLWLLVQDSPTGGNILSTSTLTIRVAQHLEKQWAFGIFSVAWPFKSMAEDLPPTLCYTVSEGKSSRSPLKPRHYGLQPVPKREIRCHQIPTVTTLETALPGCRTLLSTYPSKGCLCRQQDSTCWGHEVQWVYCPTKELF
ncbi:uncharacterized protein LOC129712869 [Leucoraja erinacea]|uniref:uncharacterized protein LOC129712869 n=1 Tax=Leucoraja erinaceus TaxID=7782 RepID=UPI0024539790|nr:uncharacterized protein LOC129712869 [Leucoraja erinacea]